MLRALTTYRANCTKCYNLKTYYMENQRDVMSIYYEKDQEIELDDPNSPCYVFPLALESLPMGKHLPRFVAVIVGHTTPMIGQYRTLWYFDYFMSKAKRVPFSNEIVLAHRFIIIADDASSATSKFYLDWVEQGVEENCQLNLHRMRLHLSEHTRSVTPLAREHTSICLALPHRIYLFGSALVTITPTNLFVLELDAVNEKLLLHVWKRVDESIGFAQKVVLNTNCPVDNIEEIRTNAKYLQRKLIARINCQDESFYYFMHDSDQGYTYVQHSPVGIFDNVMITAEKFNKRQVESFLNTDNEAIIKYKGIRLTYISNNNKLDTDLINITKSNSARHDLYGNPMYKTIFARPNFVY